LWIDYDQEQGFFEDDSSWRSERFQSGVGRNDYGNNDVLKEHFGESYFGKGPKDWRRSDARIREDVCEALWRDHRVDASNIDVEVKEGEVFLRGTVSSRDVKRRVERLVETVLGVEDVQNQLTPSADPPS
jgi:osmotically-inducible protein OsmY